MIDSGPSLVHATFAHTVNVVVHVAFGTVAMIAGFVPLVVTKGGRLHVRWGRRFLFCLRVILATAVIGVLVFSFRAFLGIITLLAAYTSYSGMRALTIRTTGPERRDIVVAVSALVFAAVFIAYLNRVTFPWSPVVIYSTLSTLVAYASYDLLRLTFPRRWFARLWLYEHLIKMLAAYSAVLSAFAGTVLVAWQPYSQLIPSVLCTSAMIGFTVYWARRPERIEQLARRGAAPVSARPDRAA